MSKPPTVFVRSVPRNTLNSPAPLLILAGPGPGLRNFWPGRLLKSPRPFPGASFPSPHSFPELPLHTWPLGSCTGMKAHSRLGHPFPHGHSVTLARQFHVHRLSHMGWTMVSTCARAALLAHSLPALCMACPVSLFFGSWSLLPYGESAHIPSGQSWWPSGIAVFSLHLPGLRPCLSCHPCRTPVSG